MRKNRNYNRKKKSILIVGKHSGVKICHWTKKSLKNEGVCYKEKFYGISCHRCCQMTCSVFNCQNQCIHCWRDLSYTKKSEVKNPEYPKKIVDDCIKMQQQLLQGYKGNENLNLKKWEEAQQPKHFAISLAGEPTLYPKLGELIKELRKRKITSFLVTNGLSPEALKKLEKQKALPTQLYVSLNAPNKKLFRKFTKNKEKDSWKKFNKTLELVKKFKTKTRRVIRITLVRNLNMDDKLINKYAKLIKKAEPDFIEIKGYMAVGYARQRLGYDRMPWYSEIKDFSKKLLSSKYLKNYKFLDEQKVSCVILLGKNRNKMKIKKNYV